MRGIKNASSALRINSNLSESYLIRGRCFYGIQNFSKAKEDLRTAVKIDSLSIGGHYYLGRSYYFLENDDSAIYCFNKAVRIKGSDSIYIEYFNKDIFNDVAMAEIRYSRAIANYQINNYNDALVDFLFSINAGYNKPDCYSYIGLIAIGKGNKEMGCKYLKMAVENGSPDAGKYLSQECKN